MNELNNIDLHKEIINIIRKFQEGYTNRNIKKIDDFMEELFIEGESTYAIGTGTTEVFLGRDKVKELIESDWKYWGDVDIDYKNAHVSIENSTAWFYANCSVVDTFEDSKERYDRYIELIKDNIENMEFSPKQKITFINWLLSLAYHQRKEGKRAYKCPLFLSGVLIRNNGQWKFSYVNFSMPKSNFPDERFEVDKSYITDYNKQNEIIKEYKYNETTSIIDTFLKKFERKFIGNPNISSLVKDYFSDNDNAYVIGTDNNVYIGIDKISEFFATNYSLNASLNIDNYISSQSGDITWVTALGRLKQNYSEEELIQKSLSEINDLFKSELTSEEKIFSIQRSISYALKESAIGEDYTFPIRISAVILNSQKSPAFASLQFSFPFSWILEGKIDSI